MSKEAKKDRFNPWTVFEKVTLKDIQLGWEKMKNARNGAQVSSFKFGTHTIVSRFDSKKTVELAEFMARNPETTRTQISDAQGILNEVAKGKCSDEDSFFRVCYCLILFEIFFDLYK